MGGAGQAVLREVEVCGGEEGEEDDEVEEDDDKRDVCAEGADQEDGADAAHCDVVEGETAVVCRGEPAAGPVDVVGGGQVVQRAEGVADFAPVGAVDDEDYEWEC